MINLSNVHFECVYLAINPSQVPEGQQGQDPKHDENIDKGKLEEYEKEYQNLKYLEDLLKKIKEKTIRFRRIFLYS